MSKYFMNLLGKNKFLTIVRLPVHIGLMVGFADGEFDKKEQKAMDEFILNSKMENRLLQEVFSYLQENLKKTVADVIELAKNSDIEKDIEKAKKILDTEITPIVSKNFLIGIFALGIYVANASGGFLGFNKISEEEFSTLEFFKEALDIKEEWWEEVS